MKSNSSAHNFLKQIFENDPEICPLDLPFRFIAKFQDLLYLPLCHSPNYRLSLGVIHLAAQSANVLCKMKVILGNSVDLSISDVLERFCHDSKHILKCSIPLLVNDVDHSVGSIAISANLHRHLIAISKSDKEEEQSLRKKNLNKVLILFLCRCRCFNYFYQLSFSIFQIFRKIGKQRRK